MDKLTAHKREVIKELFFSGELSAADISTITKKSLPIAGKILNELIHDSWIVESGYAVSTGGRRPQMFSLAPQKFYIAAISIDQHVTQAALIDVNKNIVSEVETLGLNLKDNDAALNVLKGSPSLRSMLLANTAAFIAGVPDEAQQVGGTWAVLHACRAAREAAPPPRHQVIRAAFPGAQRPQF